MKRIVFPLIAAALATLVCTSCRPSDIREVMKSLAEQPVDTADYQRHTIQLLPFQAVSIDCFADVEVIQSGDFRVEVLAPKDVIENIHTQVSNEELLVSTDRWFNMPDGVVAVVKIYAPVVNHFKLNEAKCLRLGKLRINTPFFAEIRGIGSIISSELHAPSAELKLEGAGNITLEGIHTGELRVMVSGAGNVVLEGEAHSARIDVDGAGNVNTENLKCAVKSDIRMNGMAKSKQ